MTDQMKMLNLPQSYCFKLWKMVLTVIMLL